MVPYGTHYITHPVLGFTNSGGGLGVLPEETSVVSVPLIQQAISHNSTLAWAATPTTTLAWSGTTPGTNPNLSQRIVGRTESQGLSLSPATEPFPQKLVDKVRAGQFVEMRDLLTDNISLLQQLETFNNNCQLPGLPGALRPRLRKVTSLGSWVYCFLAYNYRHQGRRPGYPPHVGIC